MSCRSSLFNKHAPKLLTVNISTVKVYCNQNKSKPSANGNVNKSNESKDRKKLKAPDIISNLVQVSYSFMLLENSYYPPSLCIVLIKRTRLGVSKL